MAAHELPGPPHPFPVARSLLSPGALAGAVAAEYGLPAVRCQLLRAGIRDTYLVTPAGATDPRYVLSVLRHGWRSAAEIEAELNLLDFLAAGGVGVAAAVPRAGGGRLLALEAPEGIRYGVLYRYVAGLPLDRLPDAALVRRCGRLLAQVHTLADGFSHHGRRPPVDTGTLLDTPLRLLAPFLAHRRDDLAYLQETVAFLRERLAALPQAPPAYGLVHGDVIPSNVLVAASGRLTLLDFDFCGPGWRAYDLASFECHAERWDVPPSVARAFRRGYREVRPLAGWEVAAIRLFVAVRHIVVFAGWTLRAEEQGTAIFTDELIDAGMAAIKRSMERVD